MEWFRPHGSGYAIHRRRPRMHEEIVEVAERPHPIIINAEPSMQLARGVGEVCGNQHIINDNQQILNERMEQLEENQELLFNASRKILHNTARQSRQLDYIGDELRYGSRMGPDVITEREIEYIAPRHAGPLLLDAPYHHHRERSYIGDGVTYITSRPHRRPGWSPPMHYAETEVSEEESVFDYEVPGRVGRRSAVVHQPACMCGGIGYHLSDCPRRRW
ncbi:MAG: hypothetical protein M1839_007890 [Geoglossum umbratile]|nr:MAG: hypothetical protein M1839_007890 [Geoglossum umbratile]